MTPHQVFKTKYNPDGLVERKKTRLVVSGFNQQEGLYYKHTFSPVAKLATFRVIIALAIAKQWPLHQLNVNNAFLPGYIDEEIYMLPPQGYNKAAKGQSKHDYSLFVKDDQNTFTATLVYVDDVLITKLCCTTIGTRLDQRKYIVDLLSDIGFTIAKRVEFPLPTELKLSLEKGTSLSDPAPKDAYMQAVMHLLRYLKGTVSKGLFYPIQPHLQITGFTDA
ncbi:retrovirus-related pol polyprotein from transposon TNT 1-94, partial [Tanacetum coccineum]